MPKFFLIRLTLFIVGLALFADAMLLVSYGKIHLGIIIPLFIGVIFCSDAVFYTQIRQWLDRHKNLQQVWKWCWRLFIVWLATLAIFFIFLTTQTQRTQSLPDLKAIIVLGSGIEHGKPSAALANRLDTAAKLAQTQPYAIIILSGGMGFGKTQTEAEVMATYLERYNAIATSRLALESQSTSTELNLKNSKAILKQHHIALNEPIAIVTSDFHTIRAHAIAKKQGYTQVYMVSAPTPLLIRYNAWLREYFAYVSGWVLNEY